MFTQQDLHELLAFDPNGTGVVSVYLNTDTTQQSVDTIKLQVKGMLKELDEAYAPDLKRIEEYLDLSFDWKHPGVALFSCSGRDLFEAYPVAVTFRNRVRDGHRPYVKPLAHLLEHYATYGVILVDRMGASFFEYHLGELQNSDGYMGEEVRKLKKGSGSSAVGTRGGNRGVDGGSRHEEEVVQRNMRDSAEAATRFFADKPVRRLFLGGTQENVAQFRDLLPKKLQSCLAGTFVMDMTAGEHEVRAETLTLLSQANAAHEVRQVDELLGLHSQGGSATVGLDDTLQAISDKRVQTLIVSDGYRTPGYVHPDSGFVVVNLARSPMGEEALTAVDDIIEEAVSLTMTQGGHVEVVANNAALESVGRIGAILRY